MKKIGIDARLYFQTGVGTYVRNFLENLQRLSPAEYIFYVYILQKDSEKIRLNNRNFIKREVTANWHSLAEQTSFLMSINKDKLDLMHFTYFSYPVLYRRKFIATIHDTTPLLFKTGKASTKNPIIYEIKHKFFKIILKSQVQNARIIITPTETVKKQLLKIYGMNLKNKIRPIYEGVDEKLLSANENISLKTKFNTDFFIYVGNFYPHKNVENLIQAFAGLKTKDKLILIGPDDFFSHRLLRFINKSELDKRIMMYKNPTIEDLVYFYKKAKALIHPSLSEGFGLPIIEAAYFGCPVIASNIEIFRELLDNQYLSFNPYKVEDIRNTIDYFIKNKPKFDIAEIIKKYSFGKMTQKTLAIYQEITKASPRILA